MAKDYYLTAEEREINAKQLEEDQKILFEQQQSFIQRKTQILAAQKIDDKQQQQQQSDQSSSTAETVQSKNILQKEEQKITIDSSKKGKLTKETAIQESQEHLIKASTIEKEKVKISESKEIKKIETKTLEKKSVKIAETNIQTSHIENIKKDQQQQQQQQISLQTKIEEKSIQKIKSETGEGKIIDINSDLCTTSIASVQPVASIASITDLIIDKTVNETTDTNLILTAASALATNQTLLHNKSFDTRQQLTNESIKKMMPYDSDNQLAQQSINKPNASSDGNQTTTNQSQSHVQSQSQLQQMHTVSIYNFGDNRGPPNSNINFFLVPTNLITYETSIEVNLRKIPFPQPPPPPKFIKKLLVHTESLERKTRAFLSGNFEVGPTDSSIRTARRKIRTLKSTILNTDDEVKHASDTITKAHSGEFFKIFAPPVIEKPLYEFIEIPSERSEEECSEYSDRRSERAISEQHENMEDYYSSKYSSRSSRKHVEGNN